MTTDDTPDFKVDEPFLLGDFRVTTHWHPHPPAPWEIDEAEGLVDFFIPTLMFHKEWQQVGLSFHDLEGPMAMVEEQRLDQPETLERLIAAVGGTADRYREYALGEGLAAEELPDPGALTGFVHAQLADKRPQVWSQAVCEYLDTLEKVYGAIDVPCLRWDGHNHAVGERRECLFVLTDDWVRVLGKEDAPEPARELTRAQAKMEAYLRRDVYLVEIRSDAGELVHSCAALYGKDAVLPHVRSTVDHLAQRQADFDDPSP